MSLLDRLLGRGESGALAPGALLARAFAPLFDRIPIDRQWERAVRSAAERGAVVHVVRNVSLLDLLALDHLTRRLGLPRIGFANELGGWLGLPIGAAGAGACRRRASRATVQAGRSAVLFMKRPPERPRSGARRTAGAARGTTLLRVLIELSARRRGARSCWCPRRWCGRSGPSGSASRSSTRSSARPISRASCAPRRSSS